MPYSINHRFFSKIDSEKSAYWLGFIYADAGIGKNYCRINLAARDEDHLLKLRKALRYEGPLKHTTSNFNTSVVNIQIGNRQIVNDLKRHGLTECKSLTQKPLNIPQSLQRHFWRGVFDGDGDITIGSKRVPTKPCWRLRLTGNRFTVEGFDDFLRANAISSSNTYPHGNVYRIEICRREQVVKLSELLYGSSRVYLSRKRERIKRVLANRGLEP